MKPQLFILTGASRGMGAALADQLFEAGHTLLCLSRQTNGALAAKAASRSAASSASCEQWAIDLAQPVEAAARLQAWLGGIDANTFGSATLINNAAALSRIGAIDDCSAAELASALRVGLEAPMLLTAAFLGATRAWPGMRRVLNISSGLGRFAMAGQASYCAVKGGLDHFTRALALDEARRPNGARVVSLAPGVIDTDMQIQMRSADAADFPDQATFIGLKRNGQLASPATAAACVLGYLNRADFGAQAVADVRDA